MRTAGAKDDGYSLVELLVVMVMFSIIMVVVMTAVIASLRTYRGTSARAIDQNSEQVALDAMSKALRTAAPQPVASGTAGNAILTAGPTDLKFYTYDVAGMGPSLVEFQVSGTNLTESVSHATNCTPPFTYGPTVTRTVATGLTAGQTVFTYATAATSGAPSGTTLTPTGSPALLSAANLANVELVTLNLSVASNSNAAAATTAFSTVSLSNHLVASAKIPGTSC